MCQNSNQDKNSLPSLQINGHYIRELSFKNNHAPASFMPQKENPKTEIAVNFNHRHIQENVYEVFLIVKAKTTSTDPDNNNAEIYDIKLAYSGLFTVNNIEDELQKESLLNIYLPTLLFPYARSVISNLTKDAGFQPLMLEHIDFAVLHQQRKAQTEKAVTVQ